MDSKSSNKSQIKIRISADNGKHVIKDEEINIGSIYNEEDGSQKHSQAPSSYLSQLSSTVKAVRKETNSVLTQFILSSSNIKDTGDNKTIESLDEDVSDDDIAG